jgi:hypothetical protein
LGNKIGLHPDNKNWEEYLTRWTTLKAEHKGWKWYNTSNQHYFVSPKGVVYSGIFGFRGEMTWNKIKAGTWEREVISSAKKIRQFQYIKRTPPRRPGLGV